MTQLFALSISDASERSTITITPLTLITSRSPSTEMVVGGLRHYHHAIDSEDALWCTTPCS
jgi:hypothetical protein